jgi:hypothetical protein
MPGPSTALVESKIMTQQTRKVHIQVTWGKCTGDKWCRLDTVDLSSPVFGDGGVYVIWHGGAKPRVVYVGQAKVIRDRLAAHRNDDRIQAYAKYGLYVTWAIVVSAHRDGVEVYLANAYEPLVGERRPTAEPITVNLPWD